MTPYREALAYYKYVLRYLRESPTGVDKFIHCRQVMDFREEVRAEYRRCLRGMETQDMGLYDAEGRVRDAFEVTHSYFYTIKFQYDYSFILPEEYTLSRGRLKKLGVLSALLAEPA